MRILSLAILAVVNCLYFEITEKDKKCFIEELPDDTQMIGKYLVQVFDKTSKEWKQSAPGFGMHVEVHDPRNKAVLSRAYGSQGRFTFTSHLPGEHKICLMANSTNWSWSGGKLRVHLDLQIGEDREGYKNSRPREIDRIATARPPTARPSAANSEGAKFPAISRGAISPNVRIDQCKSVLVGHRPDLHPRGRRLVANAAFERILRGKEVGLGRLPDTSFSSSMLTQHC